MTMKFNLKLDCMKLFVTEIVGRYMNPNWSNSANFSLGGTVPVISSAMYGHNYRPQ